MNHGIIVSDFRMDLLDKLSLTFAINSAPTIAVDVGCGNGVQGIRFAALGWDTTLYDLINIEERITQAQSLFGSTRLRSLQVDFSESNANNFPNGIGLAYSQRFIHYLRYGQARSLLQSLHSHMLPGARLFISTTNIESELGDGYAAADQLVRERFGILSSVMQKKHFITPPICLYYKHEFSELLSDCGFSELELFTSAFGAIKGVYVK